MYYLYATTKNAQIVSLELTYAPADAEVHVHTYVWDSNVGVDGSHTMVCECQASKQEACADAEPVHTAGDCKNYGSTAYTCDVCGYTWTVADTVFGAHNYVDGTCSVCGKPQPTNDTYVKVSDAATLAAGDVIILVASKTDATTSTTSYYAAGALLKLHRKAMVRFLSTLTWLLFLIRWAAMLPADGH